MTSKRQDCAAQLRVAADEGPLAVFGEAVLRGPASIVANSKDGRGPAAVLLGDRNGAFAAELVVRWADDGCSAVVFDRPETPVILRV